MDETTHAQADEQFSRHPLRRFNKGQMLIFANEEPKQIIYLLKGIIRKYEISYKGDEITVELFKSPNILPLSWLLHQTPNRYYYDAATDVQLRFIPPDVALKFIKSSKKILYNLLGSLHRDKDIMLGRMLQLMAGTAKSRLLYELCIECQRFGDKITDTSCEIQINESDLAAQTGLSRETVSREMRKLANMGLVEIKRNCIFINDFNSLYQKLDKIM